MKLFNLKALRAKNDIDQREMAKLLGVSLSTYNQKENGKVPFKEAEINKLIELFGVPYEEIFFTNKVHDNGTVNSTC